MSTKDPNAAAAKEMADSLIIFKKTFMAAGFTEQTSERLTTIVLENWVRSQQ